MAAISPARDAAFAILKAVEQGHSHSDDLLRRKAVSALSAVDCNLATTLVLGTLRWQIQLDRRLNPLLKHPNAKLDLDVLIALRLGAFQLLHLDRIPARAAIDESVELTKQAGHRFASGMVNAVLRKLAMSVASSSQSLNTLENELELTETHPAWMVERWSSLFGLEAASAICHHGQLQPSLTVRIERDAVEEELTAAGIRLQPGELLTSARTILSGDITATPAFKEGRARLQDEGSQLVAEIVPRGNTVLDCCAAPGGKTLILADRNPGAHIVACEHSPQRLAQLGKRLKYLGVRVECRPADATALSDESVYDVALADVPCSGTGTLGRNPEIRHRLRLEDLSRQAERQMAILRSALRAVRPGGRVVYSTCSLEPEENEQVLTAVLAESKNARQVPLQTRLVELRGDGILTIVGGERLLGCCTGDGSLRLLPGVFHTDGFFIAVLEKIR
jgi:16S rRNA (cytosine967-C5)-methyltransferase